MKSMLRQQREGMSSAVSPAGRMLGRVPQQGEDDCVTCVIAMVLGYPYERVLRDSARYEQRNADGKFVEWWVEYIQSQGRSLKRRPLMEAYDFWKAPSQPVGILGMAIPHLKRRHVAAVDAAGVVDPADGFPDHLHLADYIASRSQQGFVFDTDFLAVYGE